MAHHRTAACLEYYNDTRLDDVGADPFRQIVIRDATREEVLALPNRFPIGLGGTASRARNAMIEFYGRTNQRHNVRWGVVADLAVIVIFYISLQKPDREVANNAILAGRNGSRIKRSYHEYKFKMVSLVIFKFAYGWHLTLESMESLNAFSVRNGEVHACFVLPLVHFYIECLDRERFTTTDDILGTNVGHFEKGSLQKARKYGIWSNTYVRDLVRNAQINHRDQRMCRGIEYGLARLFMLISRRFGVHARDLFTTQAEKDLLGRDIPRVFRRMYA